MLNANRFKLGLFVIIGIILIIIALFIHGLGSMFEEKYELFTIFDESVQGLEVGSEVKFKGVKLGNVSEIEIYGEKYIKVTMEIRPGAAQTKERRQKTASMSNEKKKEQAYTFLQSEIKKGLTCELTMAGITGMKFIELNHNSNEKLLVKLDIEDDAYIPSSKGILTGTMLSFNEAISKIAEMDFKGISTELKETLKSIKDTINKPQLDSTLTDVSIAAKDFRKIVGTLNENLNSKVIESTLSNVEKSFAEIKTLAHTMNEEVKKVKLGILSENATATLKSIGGAAKQFDTSIGSIEKEFNTTLKTINSLSKDIAQLKKDFNGYGSDIGKEGKKLKASLENALLKIESTLNTIESFFEMIEKDPGSLLHGKSNKE